MIDCSSPILHIAPYSIIFNRDLFGHSCATPSVGARGGSYPPAIMRYRQFKVLPRTINISSYSSPRAFLRRLFNNLDAIESSCTHSVGVSFFSCT